MAEARIAVIDDDPSQVGVLKELLEDEGYQVIAHGDVLDAVAFIKQERPSLTLLDLVQGNRLVGLDVLRELERDPTTRDPSSSSPRTRSLCATRLTNSASWESPR